MIDHTVGLKLACRCWPTFWAVSPTFFFFLEWNPVKESTVSFSFGVNHTYLLQWPIAIMEMTNLFLPWLSFLPIVKVGCHIGDIFKVAQKISLDKKIIIISSLTIKVTKMLLPIQWTIHSSLIHQTVLST